MKQISLLVVISLFLYSCKHEIERASWEVDLLTPLVKNSIDITNMISDSSITVSSDDSGRINLIFQQNFLDINFDSLIKLELTTNEESNKIDSISFADVSISDSVTIGSVIEDVLGPLATFFPPGSSRIIPNLPSIVQNDTTNIDASEYFTTMTLYKGSLIVKIYNGFPTTISNISISIINTNTQNLIGNLNFGYIQSNTSQIDSIPIGGMILDQNMYAIIHNMDIEGTTDSVPIIYTDAIITTITISDIGITHATAIFPQQQISETLKEHSFDMKKVELKEVKLAKGIVTINAVSTLPDTGRILYNIPSLTQNGIPFESVNIIPPSINGEMTTITHNLDDYLLDLSGKDGRIGGDTINTIYTEFFAFIDSTGEVVTINQSDSFYSYIDFNLTPEYARGYLGEDTINNVQETEITNFNKILSVDNLELRNVNLDLTITNYLGADANLVFKELETSNSLITIPVTQDLSGEDVIGKLYNIERATEIGGVFPINPTTTKIGLKGEEMIEILPDKIKSNIDFYLNPYGQQITDDFLYPTYPIEASLEIEVPLILTTENLILIDTNDVNFQRDNIEIEKLFLHIQNGFPIDCKIKLILLDNNNNILDTLFKNSQPIRSASVNEDLIVTKPTTSILEEEFNYPEEKYKIITLASFSTSIINNYTTIYDKYSIEITLSAKWKKNIGR